MYYPKLSFEFVLRCFMITEAFFLHNFSFTYCFVTSLLVQLLLRFSSEWQVKVRIAYNHHNSIISLADKVYLFAAYVIAQSGLSFYGIIYDINHCIHYKCALESCCKSAY